MAKLVVQKKESEPSYELCLLIYKALEYSRFSETASLFKKQLEERHPQTRVDYLGETHKSDLLTELTNYPNLNANTLELICKRLKCITDSRLDGARIFNSLLSAGKRYLLHTEESLFKEEVKFSATSLLSKRLYAPAYRNHSVNILKQIQSRKIRGPATIRRSVPTEFHARTILYRRIFGHLAPVYCVTFDMTGQYIFTGADDNLIKIWSARDGRLLSTLRGHSGEITDLSVNYENRLLASGSMDKFVRVWDLKTTRMIECLNAHTAMITSVKFAPFNRHGSDRYLISTSNDGSIVFWHYHRDNFGFNRHKKLKERCRPGGQMVCSAFSAGGSFLACGSSDHVVHVYGFHEYAGPSQVIELHEHTDQVDSIQFSNYGFRFVSGSKDGTAMIWRFTRKKWVPIKLNMSTGYTPRNVTNSSDQKPPSVNMVNWSTDDRFVITSISNHTVKIWNSHTGQLIHTLDKHTSDVYLIESHPKDPRIFLTAGHDGKIIIWDIERGIPIKIFQNIVDGQTVASLYDCKFSPDGHMFVATDSYGHLSLFGFGSDDPYQSIPDQMFFNYDYRGLVRDLNNFVMDEQTHLPPHLMSHLMQLVDMNGAPHPRIYQRLVPSYAEADVVAALSHAQLQNMAAHITEHSREEENEYMFENEIRDPPIIYNNDDDDTDDTDETEIDLEETDIDMDQTDIDTDQTEVTDIDSDNTEIDYRDQYESRPHNLRTRRQTRVTQTRSSHHEPTTTTARRYDLRQKRKRIKFRR